MKNSKAHLRDKASVGDTQLVANSECLGGFARQRLQPSQAFPDDQRRPLLAVDPSFIQPATEQAPAELPELGRGGWVAVLTAAAGPGFAAAGCRS